VPATAACEQLGESEQILVPVYSFTVENCTDSDLTNVKVQGGTSGWTSLSGTPTATKGSVVVKNNNKNSIITWTLNLAQGESATITVTVCGSLKASACGTTQFLSGPWSAAYIDPDTGDPAKTDYTDRFSIDVICP